MLSGGWNASHRRTDTFDAFDPPAALDSPGAGSSSSGPNGWTGTTTSRGLESAPSWRKAFDFASPDEEVEQAAVTTQGKGFGAPVSGFYAEPVPSAARVSPLDQYLDPPAQRKSPLDEYLGEGSLPRKSAFDQYLDSPREDPSPVLEEETGTWNGGRFGQAVENRYSSYGWENGNAASAEPAGRHSAFDSSDEEGRGGLSRRGLQGPSAAKEAPKPATKSKGGFKNLIEDEDEDAYEGLVRLPDFIVLERRQKKWEEEDRKRREEEDRRQRELEAKRKLEEEARQRQAEERRKAEEERAKAEQARRQAEEAQAQRLRQQQQVQAAKTAQLRQAANVVGARKAGPAAGAQQHAQTSRLNAAGVESLGTLQEQVNKLHELGFIDDALNIAVLTKNGRDMTATVNELFQRKANAPSGQKQPVLNPSRRAPVAPTKYTSQHSQLQELGFSNLELNARLLEKYQGDINATLDALASLDEDRGTARQVPAAGGFDLLTGEVVTAPPSTVGTGAKGGEDLKWMFQAVPGGKVQQSRGGAASPVQAGGNAGVEYYAGRDLQQSGYQMPGWTADRAATSSKAQPQGGVRSADVDDIEDRIQQLMDKVPSHPLSAGNTPSWVMPSAPAGVPKSAPTSRQGSPLPARNLAAPLPEDLFSGHSFAPPQTSQPARGGGGIFGQKRSPPRAAVKQQPPQQASQQMPRPQSEGTLSGGGWNNGGGAATVFTERNFADVPSVLSYGTMGVGAENVKPKKSHGIHLFGWGKHSEAKPEPAFSGLAAVKPKSEKELAREAKERAKEDERLAKELKKKEKELKKKEEEILRREKKLVKS